ncbi:MAG TPA: cellulase family glycosylhydrolase [Lacipirellula sp.]
MFRISLIVFMAGSVAAAEPLQRVRVSDDGKTFVTVDAGRQVQLWGVNYDHDRDNRLLEDYWHDEWPAVVEDFREIKELNANCIRIHLQFARFMKSTDEPDANNLAQLAKLIALAEEHGLYLLITGLGCYHKQDVPPWYDALSEDQRWQAQAKFWQAIAAVGKDSPAVFAYDLMNEPILPGDKPESEWLAKPLGDKHFVQRIALDLAGRTRQNIAKAWVDMLATAIHEVDPQSMITVGVIPWAHVWPTARPLFYSPEVGRPLDFVSVHFYPERGEVQKALDALRVYEVGKPLVIEEIFPLKTSGEEVLQFIDDSKPIADGWISFYWGETIDECEARGDMAGAITAAWLKQFRDNSRDRSPPPASVSE